MKMRLKRRIKGKTDYRARIKLLKSEFGRIVFRKTNKYIIGQYIESEEAKDKVIVGVNSKNLLNYGWPKEASGSLKCLAASYLTGFLLGKKILDREKNGGVADLGLIRSIAKSKAYSFLKGVADSGINIKVKKEMFPEEKRIKTSLKAKIEFDKIKQNIEKKFI